MLNRWIMKVVALGIFATMVDLVLYEEHTKKYVRFFVGLIILIIVVEPISKFVKDLPILGDKALGDIEEWGTMETGIVGSPKNNKDYIMDLYRHNLEEDICRRIGGYLPSYSIWASVSLSDTGDDGFVSIESIYLTLGLGAGLKIKPVILPYNIGGPNADNGDTDISKVMELIRKDLSNIYEVEESRIYIEIES